MLDVALDYCRRGWNPVPIPYRIKKPTGSNWGLLRITTETAPLYFNSAASNIGVRLVTASNGPTDIDLDSTLKGVGFDWRDLARAAATNFSGRMRDLSRIEPDAARDWANVAHLCRDHHHGRLTDRERAPVTDMVMWRRWREPTDRQAAWLTDIAGRLREARSP
jgi:hypothetical protein